MDKDTIYGLLLIKKISSQDIADRLGISVQLVHMTIRGERVNGPDAQRVRSALAAELGIPEDEIPSGKAVAA